MRVGLADASLVTGVPVRTLRRWVAQGRLTAVRRGRVALVEPAEVDELAEQREVRAGGRLAKWERMAA